MFKADRSQDRQLFAFSLGELVPDDSDVWLFVDLFDQLSLAEFEADYSTQGEEAHEPRLILRTIFYGLTHGLASGRKLEDACRYDGRYMVLSGGNNPSYRTFARFVRRHESRLEGLFRQVVRLAQKAGLVSLGKVAIDGSRFKANTSKHKAMSYARMEKAVGEILTELETLKAELRKANAEEENATRLKGEIRLREQRLAKIRAAKAALEAEAKGEVVEPSKQKSFHDHDALPMAKTKSGFQYGYNCQLAVDEKHQIIVAAEVHDNSADHGALEFVLAKAIETMGGKKPGAILADAGYFSYCNLAAINAQGAAAYVAKGKGETVKKGLPAHEVRYFPRPDQYRCRRGYVLEKSGGSNRMQGLSLSKAACRGCPRQPGCPVAARGGKPFWIPFGVEREAALAHETLMSRPEASAIYRRRKAIVEPVFGNLKNKGLRIQVTGRRKVAAWWHLAAAAHNVEKIIKKRH